MSNAKTVEEEFTQEMLDWINDDNVVNIGGGFYREQTTQWNVKFTKSELIAFFNKEYTNT